MQGLSWERMTQLHDCNKISKDEWLINIKNCDEDITKKQRIERIPSMMRENEFNKKCFDPLVVSIGPYHHGKTQLKEAEMLKCTFAKKFLQACGDRESQLYEEVAEVARCARECYEEGSTTIYDDESFTRMMFLDACFVIQYMCILTGTQPKENDRRLTMKSYVSAFVWRDLFLLENQIPLPVLKVLLKFRFKPEDDKKLIQDFLDRFTSRRPPEINSCTDLLEKFIDKFCSTTTSDETKKKQELQLDASPHLLDLMWRHLTGLPDPKNQILERSDQWHSYRSVTELEAAGIHFRASKTHNVTDVDFKDRLVYGTMIIPPLVVDDSTKPLLLNLVAYEMSPDGPSDPRIMSYIWLMDSLIDHANDVKELRRKGILINSLGSDENLAILFNEIANDLVPDLRAYAKVKDRLEKHWRNKCQVWIAEWKHNHFSSPWTVLAFLGAIFALALSTVQTYFSVFPRS